MIKFIGTGSAFNTELGNNSAFIRKDKSLLLIDCGGTVFHRIQELNLLKDIENLYIVITHTHPDHVGSLGDLIFYAYYILNIKPLILFPCKDLLNSFLNNIGVTKEMYGINNNKVVSINDNILGKLRIEFLKASHVDTIPAYSFILNIKENSIYYSGDSNKISLEVIEKLKDGSLKRLYQDTCGLDYEGNVHLSINKLCDLIESKYRKNVFCMHLDKHITEKDIRDKGFNIAVKQI